MGGAGVQFSTENISFRGYTMLNKATRFLFINCSAIPSPNFDQDTSLLFGTRNSLVDPE